MEYTAEQRERFNELRIRRKLTNKASSKIAKIGRAPALDRIRSFARREARTANLLYAMNAGKALSYVETRPKNQPYQETRHNKNWVDLIQYDRTVLNILLESGVKYSDAVRWINNG